LLRGYLKLKSPFRRRRYRRAGGHRADWGHRRDCSKTHSKGSGSHAATCLNEFAARVWRECDGETSVAEIADELGEDERAVWLALHKLSKSKAPESFSSNSFSHPAAIEANARVGERMIYREPDGCRGREPKKPKESRWDATTPARAKVRQLSCADEKKCEFQIDSCYERAVRT